MNTNTDKPSATVPALADSLEYLNKRQMAAWLGVSVRTIDNLLRARKIPFVRLSARLVRFPRSEVDAHFARNARVNPRTLAV